MILRGAILSTERVTLRPRVAEPQAPMPAQPTGSQREALLQSLAYGEPLQPPIDCPITERPLDAEAVEAWLTLQDGATRARIAGVLAGEVEQVLAVARTEGAEQGRREALARVKAETASALAAFAQLAKAAEAAFDRESAQLAGQCGELVAEAIARIAGPALARPEATLGIVLNLLGRVKDERELVIRVSEADVAFLQSQRQALSAAASGRNVSIVADQRAALGGCIVESKLGSLDGRLETQLAELFATIRSARAAQPEST